MNDNVRVGRESMTKKISFHQKQSRAYKTIESLQKEPTRKKIALHDYNLKKDQPILQNSSQLKHHDRKIKSTGKYEMKKLSETHKKRSLLASEPELATIEGLLNRNMQAIKFSVSRERDRLLAKQKYKRSEQVRSLMDNKKMSSITKIQRKDTEHSGRMLDPSVPKQRPAPEFRDLNLEAVINPQPQKHHEVTLQDCFEEGCLIFCFYLQCREERLAGSGDVNTLQLKQVKQELGAILEDAASRFRTILQEVGELSLKNLLMIAIISYEYGRFSDTIMYLGKVFDKTDGNLFKLGLPAEHTQEMESPKRKWLLYLMGYLCLAEAYKNTNNYLCAINVLLKCQAELKIKWGAKQSLSLKQHYQTLQPKEAEEEKIQFRGERVKKKSYLLSALQPEPTTNKFKKYSHTHNYSSIQLSKSKQRFESSYRPEPEESKVSNSESSQYTKERVAIHLLLGRLYIKIKSYDLAISHYKKCLDIYFRNIEPLLQLASIYYVRYNSKKSLEWLDQCLISLQKEDIQDAKWQLDVSYVRYHKCLILLQERRLEESYQLLCSLTVKQLSSEVNYYKGLIRMKKLNEIWSNSAVERNLEIESILMCFSQSISAFTSKEYLVKSYFQIILILVFEKKDYYGAQYEVNRFKKLVPFKQDSSHNEQVAVSRISKIYEEEEVTEKEGESNGWTKDSHISMLFEIIDGVICILKMKIGKGITIFKEASLKIESYADEVHRHFGHYYQEIIKLLFQFKFYGYYILREYELSLKHVNKLIDIMESENQSLQEASQQFKNAHAVELKLITINKLMLECMILMKQAKFNYAMSKLTEIESLFNQPGALASQTNQTVNSALILNNFNMVKSLCYINLYTQLESERPIEKEEKQEDGEDNNKEILLSAEQLLRHCLISDKENSLIYYLISVIHYELQEYESSLKYIREALQFSDDHMIKHYFSKANTKAMLGRYDEAIKDYTNAIIVYKEQLKGETQQNKNEPMKKGKPKEDPDEEYHSQKQTMFNEIYLNRAIVYLKYAYQLSEEKNYGESCNVISSYRMKAGEDILKYFAGVLEKKSEVTERQLRDRALLLLHTDDPSQVLELGKQWISKTRLVEDEQIIKVYYLIKELNNCIIHLRGFIAGQEKSTLQREQIKNKKDNLPPKHKKISMVLPKKQTQVSFDSLRLLQLKFDLKCLQALKKSSSRTQGALEEALIALLEITEEIYRKREEELGQQAGTSGCTLEQLFKVNCGEIFRWSDILFFIGVIHFQLGEYETAIKYFEQSYNEKKANGTLYSLDRYFAPILAKNGQEQEDQEFLFYELEPLFENRIYCKEELDYNLGICYLLLKKYKQAYYYLQSYPNFLMLIKKAITVQSYQQNEFLHDSQRSQAESNLESPLPLKQFKMGKKSRSKQINTSKISSLSESLSAVSQKESQSDDTYHNITPFPTHNRLCSIYSPKVIDDKKFFLSFCLPKVELPRLGLFHEDEIEPGRKTSSSDQTARDPSSDESRIKDLVSEKECHYKIDRRAFQSVVKHITLMDLEMKPIAPWIRQNTCGVIFTENLINESVELNSDRLEKRKDKTEDKEDGTKRNKKERYAE